MGAQTLYLPPCERPASGAVFLRRRASSRSLQVRLRGTVSNAEGLGARVEVHLRGAVQVREVSGAGGTLSWSARVLHFGLGAQPAAERVVVRWPSGAAQELTDLAAGRLVVIEEPAWFRLTADPAGSARVQVTAGAQARPTVTLEGDARWVEPLGYDPAAGVWRALLRGAGLVRVVVAVPGTRLHAARWVPLAAR